LSKKYQIKAIANSEKFLMGLLIFFIIAAVAWIAFSYSNQESSDVKCVKKRISNHESMISDLESKNQELNRLKNQILSTN
jgi:sensor histidine kinase YesM